MRIVQVLLDERIGGAERLAATLEREWSAVGDVTSVVLLDPVAGVATDPLARLRRLRRALRDESADLVVAHSALPNLYARLAAPFGASVVSVLHSAQDDFEERGLRMAERVLHRRGAVVAVSDEQRQVYSRRFPSARVRTIANGITPDLPRRGAERAAADPMRVVTISRIAEQKRPQLWQAVAQELAEESFALQWWGPAVDDESTALVRSHVLAGAPGRFAGRTDAVGEVLADADVLLHTASREASSIGLMEAAAVGLPIVCASSVERTLPRGLAFAAFDDASGAAAALRAVRDDYPAARAHALRYREEVRELASAAQCAASYRLLAFRARGRRLAGGSIRLAADGGGPR